MTIYSEKPISKALMIITLSAFVVLILIGLIFLRVELPDAIKINIKGQPTIGYTKAKIHVVVFEEPKCSNCRDFSNQIYPHIKENYIDKNKITFTIIPVSFLPGSMPACVALLCAYYGDPLYPNSDIFFAYLKYIYEHQPQESQDWATTDRLVEFAEKTSPAIDTAKLRKCIDKEAYRVKIQQNTEYGKKIMGGVISTPTVFVNGIEVKELTVDSISKLIDEVERSGGKK